MHDARQQKRMAVRLGLGHELSGDVPSGARTILDDEGLPPGVGEVLAVEPRHEVDAAAGRKANENSHRFARIAVLSAGRGRRRCDDKEGRESKNAKLTHGYLPESLDPRSSHQAVFPASTRTSTAARACVDVATCRPSAAQRFAMRSTR